MQLWVRCLTTYSVAPRSLSNFPPNTNYGFSNGRNSSRYSSFISQLFANAQQRSAKTDFRRAKPSRDYLVEEPRKPRFTETISASRRAATAKDGAEPRLAIIVNWSNIRHTYVASVSGGCIVHIRNPSGVLSRFFLVETNLKSVGTKTHPVTEP